MKRKKLLLVAGSILVLAACSPRPVTEKTSPVKVSVVKVDTESINGMFRFPGVTEAETTVSLSFATPGTVESVAVSEGVRVVAGQLLAIIDSTSASSAHQASLATLRQAEDAYRRMKQLHDKGSLSDIKMIEMESKLQQSRSMEEISRKALSDCRLYAPYAGVISKKSIEVGETVVPGVSAFKLELVDDMRVKVSVPETEIARVAIGTPAEISIPAVAGLYKGKVIEKGVVANPISRSYNVKVAIARPDALVMPGMVADVTIADETCDRILLPAEVVQLDERNNSFVWLVVDGKAIRREVRCGGYAGEKVVILDGLSQGDSVIVEGRQKVCENTPVAF